MDNARESRRLLVRHVRRELEHLRDLLATAAPYAWDDGQSEGIHVSSLHWHVAKASEEAERAITTYRPSAVRVVETADSWVGGSD